MVTHINPSASRSTPNDTVAGPQKTVTTPSSPQPERSKFRIMPLTMTMLGLLLIVKTNDVYFSAQALRSALVANAQAEEAKPEKKEAEAPENAKEPEEDKGEDAAAKEEAGHGEAASEEGGHGDAKEGEGGHGDGKKDEKKEAAPPKISEGEIRALKKLDEQTKYNQIELDLLHNLAKRRDELDAREKELDLKGKVLEATEQRINGRIDEMKTLQTEVKALIDNYKAQQDADVKSLVKIYENMKPADAAAIFDELDMPILLSVIDKMSERKVAPVLAAMTPKRAKEVTEELAELRKSTMLPAEAGSVAKP